MIEPQEEMRETLTGMCRENANLEFIQAGAGREPGESVQTIWNDLNGSSFLPAGDEDKIRNGKQRITPVIRITDILEERGDFFPDLIKLDIQGFELEALKGAMTVFGKAELFILETNIYKFMPTMPVTLDCMNFMHEHGYDFYDVTDYLRRPLDGALGQIDLAFAKSDGVLRKSDNWMAK